MARTPFADLTSPQKLFGPPMPTPYVDTLVRGTGGVEN